MHFEFSTSKIYNVHFPIAVNRFLSAMRFIGYFEILFVDMGSWRMSRGLFFKDFQNPLGIVSSVDIRTSDLRTRN